MRFIYFLTSLIGAFLVSLLVILLITFLSSESPGLGVALAYFVPASFFFILIGALFGEILLKLKTFSTWWRGFWAFTLLGALYGCLIIALVSTTLGNPVEILGWLWVVAMIIITSSVFYAIRSKLGQNTISNTTSPRPKS
ncbi:peptidoglycan/LPS O-acetylase OafA/YrhL [Pullulanibacillus pueri]|uniref:hypothetical protein n=1 Tax=Pullulanibacillus pueri TaxID=1437324 RepID=UPI00166D7F28|nr:hypothetical protein [Pullulanibacillus pueri]MBM7682660.1 peptidoglycan/LPS O-acetylase OafA/YrhL [Pullulanibacillus pueri]